MMSSRGKLAPSAPVSFRLSQQASSSTLVDHTRTRTTSGASGAPKSVRSSHSRGSLFNLNLTGPASRTSSNGDLAALGNVAPSVDGPRPEASGQPSEADLFGFVDRFRSLVNQVSRETDDGLEIVPTNSTSGGYSPSSPNATQTLNGEELAHLLRSGEFGPPQPPDDHVMVLGGYVRRMSTIESVGSREQGSIASSVHRNGTFMSSNRSGSGHTQYSRPPTRANTLAASEAASEPPSPSSSLNASSVATGGHGGSNKHSSYQSTSVLAGNPDTLMESPIDVGSSTQGGSIIL
jgi:hypothetical protein